ncbi:MAG: hypothetical protein PHE79_08585 [Eubacteriales bacterium]|nr:hypothetical protein [Eubacteriales bacterium]
MTKKNTPPVFTGLTGDEIIAQRRGQKVGLLGDEIIAQRNVVKNTTTQDVVPKLADPKIIPPKNIREGEIKQYSPTLGRRVMDIGRSVANFGKGVTKKVDNFIAGASKEQAETPTTRSEYKTTQLRALETSIRDFQDGDKQDIITKLRNKKQNLTKPSKGLISGDALKEEGFLQAIKEGWQLTDLETQRAIEDYKMRQGLENKSAELTAKIKSRPDLQEAVPYEFSNAALSQHIKHALRGGAGLLNQIVQVAGAGAKEGIVIGGAVGGVAALAGPTGPQLLLTPVTVPSATALGATYGFMHGSMKFMTALEGGSAYREYIELGVDPKYAGPLSDAVGLVNATIEQVQLGQALKAIPGGTAALKGIKEAVVQRSANLLKNRLFAAAAKYGKSVAAQTAEEVVQEAVTIAGREVAAIIDEAANVPHMTGKDLLDRLAGTAIEAGTAFSVLPLPGMAAQAGLNYIDSRVSAKEQQFMKAAQQAAPEEGEGVVEQSTQTEPVQPIQMEGETQTSLTDPESSFIAAAKEEIADVPEFVQSPEAGNMIIEQRKTNKVIDTEYDPKKYNLKRTPEIGKAIREQKAGSQTQHFAIKKPLVSDETEITTGKTAKIVLYRGGGKPKSEIYNWAETPVAGEGEYWAFDEKEAELYGEKIDAKEVTINNPLVVSDDKKWRVLTQKAGWEHPNPYGSDKEKIKTLTEQLKNVIVSDGYDALVVKMNAAGDYAKTLRNVFGHDQVVLYEQKPKTQEKASKLIPAGADTKAEEPAPKEPVAEQPKEEKQNISSEKQKNEKPQAQVGPLEINKKETSESVQEIKGDVQKTKTPLEQLKDDMKRFDVNMNERRNVIEFYKKHIEGAKKAGLNIEHVVSFTKQFSDGVTKKMLEAHGLEKGTDAYVAGKALLEKKGAVLKTSVELLANPEKPITQELIHEYAELWIMLWGLTDKKSLSMAIDSLADKGIDRARAREHLSEIFADYVLSHKNFNSESKTFFGKMIKKFKEWVEDVVERLTYFRKNVKTRLSKEIKEQAEAFSRGDWEKAFRKLKTGWTPEITAYSLKNAGINKERRAFENAVAKAYRQIGAPEWNKRVFDYQAYRRDEDKLPHERGRAYFRRKKPMRYLLTLWGGTAEDAGFETVNNSFNMDQYNSFVPVRIPDNTLGQRYVVNAHSPREAVKKLGLKDIKPFTTRNMYDDVNYTATFNIDVRNLYNDQEDSVPSTITFTIDKKGKVRYLRRWINIHLPHRPGEDTEALYESWDYAARRYSIKPHSTLEEYEDFIKKPPIKVIRVSGDEIQGKTIKELRTSAWEKVSPLLNQKYHNGDTGFDILIVRKSVEHGFSNFGKEQIVSSIVLPDLIKNAVKIATNPPRVPKPQIKYYHTFFAPLQIKNELYNVKLTVMETVDGKKLYDHNALKIDRSDFAGRDSSHDGKLVYPPKSDLSEISITDLLSSIKGDDRKYLPEWFKNGELSIKTSNFDPILETYKKLFPDRKDKKNTFIFNTFIDDRNWDEIGDRRINAFSYDNPGIRPWIIQEAEFLQQELSDTQPAERYHIDDYEYWRQLGSGESPWGGSPRIASESIARIKDLTGASYAQIKDALERLINGEGEENTALCKRIELIINDRLTLGYKTIDGYSIPPDDEYIKFKGYLQREYYKDTGIDGKSSGTSNLTSPIGQSGVGLATGKNTAGKAKRASEIVKDFERRLNTTIKKGVKNWRHLGEFENRTHIIRIAKANDLATLAHEVGHYFDKLFTLTDIIVLKQRLGDVATVEASLLSLGKRTSKKSYAKYKVRREGIAEFFHDYFTDKDKADKQYPELTNYVKKYVPKDVLTTVEEIARDVWDLVNLDPIARGLSQIQFKGDPHYPAPVNVTRLLRQIYTGIVDATHPVEWAAGELGGKAFQDEINNELSVLRGWEGIALADINPKGEEGYYQADLDEKKVGESYSEITKEIHKNEEIRRLFWLYSVARRNEDYTKLGLDMPDSPETYAEQIRILELKHPEFKEIFEKTRQYRSNAYDLLVQGGIYSEETKAEIEKANPNYVSLKRIKEAFDYVAGTSPRLGGAKKVVKRRTGGGEDIMDPEESDINNTFIYRNVAMRNKLLLKLVDMSELAEGKGAIITKAKDKFKATEFNLNKVKKYLYDVFDGVEEIREKYGDAKKFVDSLDLNTMVRIFDPQYLAGPNQIVVYRDGSPELYDVHPDVHEAIKGLTPETLGPIVKFLAGVSQVRRTGIIFTLQFVYRNLGRDTQHNLVSSDSGIHIGNVISGFYSALKGDKWGQIMSRMGGTTNYFTANERKYAQEAIDEILANGKRHKEFVNKLASAVRLTKLGHPAQGAVEAGKSIGVIFKVIQDMIDPTEQAGRIAETKKAIIKYLKAAGYTDADVKGMDAQQLLEIVPQKELKEDVARGRNLSVDFRKMGGWVRKMQLNRMLIFFNPQVQGLANVARLFKQHPVRTTVRGLLYITLPTLALMWLNWDNPYYHELPWWRRDLAWNIPLGNPKTTKWFFPIPKPWEFGLIFGALPERLLYERLSKDPAAWNEFDKVTRDTILPDVLGSSPIGPLYEDATGEDWRGRNILSMADQRVSPYLQYNEYTSIVARKVSEGLKDIPGLPEFIRSPKRLQKVLEGYTGTLGRNALDTIDQLTGNKPGIPLISGLKRSFIVDAQQSPRSVDKFYKYKGELETQYSDAKKLGKDLSPEVSVMRTAFNAASTIVNELEDVIAAIERSGRPNKNLEMSAIKADLIQTAKAVNEAYEKILPIKRK